MNDFISLSFSLIDWLARWMASSESKARSRAERPVGKPNNSCYSRRTSLLMTVRAHLSVPGQAKVKVLNARQMIVCIEWLSICLCGTSVCVLILFIGTWPFASRLPLLFVMRSIETIITMCGQLTSFVSFTTHRTKSSPMGGKTLVHTSLPQIIEPRRLCLS